MSQQNQQSKKKCAYCGLQNDKYLVKCECGKHFCNGIGDGGYSHIVFHLAKSRHSEITFPNVSKFSNRKLECVNCTNSNPFNLLIVHSHDKSKMAILCTECRYKNEDLDRLGWDKNNAQRIIEDRHFLELIIPVPSQHQFDIVSKISFNEIRRLENQWQTDRNKRDNDKIFLSEPVRRVTLNYRDCEDYWKTFDPLIKIEAKMDKQRRENECISGLNIEFDHERTLDNFNDELYVKFEKPLNDDVRITMYDSIIFYLPLKGKTISVSEIHDCEYLPNETEEMLQVLSKLNTFISGEVVQLQKSKIVVKLKVSNWVPKEKQLLLNHHKQSKFNCCFEWLSIPFKRLREALDKFKKIDEEERKPNQMSEYLQRRILGIPLNEVDILNEEVFKEEKEKYLISRNGKDSMNAPNLPPLNEVQKKVVIESFKNQLSLIQGPPGTGKTVTSATIIYHAVKANPGKKILVCASSNIAVDQLGMKLVQAGLKVCRVYGKNRELGDGIMENFALHQLKEQELKKDEEIYKLHLKQKKGVDELSSNERKQLEIKEATIELDILRKHDVICCTCSVSGSKKLDGIMADIDTVLIDESTQAQEPECLISLMNSVRQLFLVGDHCQLGPVLNSKEAKRNGLGLPLFSRLLQLGHKPHRLQIQYRMHPALSEFSSNIFYDGMLLNGVSINERQFDNLGRMWCKKEKPMMFIAADGKETFGSNGISLLNEKEVSIVEEVVLYMLKCCVKGEQIGIITPYISQKHEIMRRLSTNKQIPTEDLENIEIASVDSFQGREKDFIIFSAVRSSITKQIGFLNNPQRLNVSITRAKYGLIVIGNPDTLSVDALWSNYLHFFKRNGLLVQGTIEKMTEYPIKLQPLDLPSIFHTFVAQAQIFGDSTPLDDQNYFKYQNDNFKPFNPMNNFMLGSSNMDEENWEMTQSEEFIASEYIEENDDEIEEDDYSSDEEDGFLLL